MKKNDLQKKCQKMDGMDVRIGEREELKKLKANDRYTKTIEDKRANSL